MIRTTLVCIWLFSLHVAGLCRTNETFGDHLQQVEKNQYLLLRINKYSPQNIEELLTHLRTYEGKVVEAYFDYDQSELAIYYTSAIQMDDILWIVSGFFKDYDKIGGTGL